MWINVYLFVGCYLVIVGDFYLGCFMLVMLIVEYVYYYWIGDNDLRGIGMGMEKF